MLVRSYTIEELSGDDKKKIILRCQDDIEIGIEPTKEGTSLYLYFGGEIIKRDFDYLIKPKASYSYSECKHHNGWFKRIIFKKWWFTFHRTYYFCTDCHSVITKQELNKNK